MKKFLLISLILSVSIHIQAQSTKSIAGEYFLNGVMETASGFKLNADSSFEFFFSYGALDRSGKGVWQQKDNKIIFNSPVIKGNNFALVNRKSTNDDRITIKIIDENQFLISHVSCKLSSGTEKLMAESNEKGEISFDKIRVDSILLISEFCPERPAVFAFENKEDNYFEFRFEPWLMEVFFNSLILKIDESGLTGQHPLLTPGEYHFIKNER